MATIKDIAKLAGVSHGTVSNVLNKTGKVKIEKIKLVEKAIETLQYTPNAQAQVLRQGSKTLVVVVLPTLDTTSYRDIFHVIHETFSEKKYDVMLFTTNGLQARELEILPTLPLSQTMVLFFVTCLSEFPSNFSPASPVVFLNRLPKHSCKNVFDFSFNYKQAGSDIAKAIIQKKAKSVTIVRKYAEDPTMHPLLLQLLKVLQESTITVSDVASSTNLLPNKAYDILNIDKPSDIIFTLEEDDADIVSLIASKIKIKPSIISLASYRTFTKHEYEVYDLNYKMFAKEACKILLECIENNSSCQTTLRYPCKGFSKKELYAKKNITLKLLTVDNPSTEALKKIATTYFLETGVTLEFNTKDYDELFSLLASQKNHEHDLIRLDLVGLQALGEEILLPLDKYQNSIAPILQSLSPDALRFHASIGNTVYAIPFDPSCQILLYREDLFEDAIIKRQYYEMYHETLEVPKNFSQFNNIAAFFTRSKNPLSPTEYGTTSTHGTASVASCDFLPRLLYSNLALIDPDGRVIIDTEDALSVLVSYLETTTYTSKGISTWWKEAAEEFAQGNVAMQINFSNFTESIFRPSKSNVVGKVGIAPVPGKSPVLGGGSIGINKFSQKVEHCIDFFKWFYQDEVACEFAYFGGLSPHNSVYSNWDIMKTFPWTVELQRGLKYGLRNINHASKINNISLKQFESILGTAVKNAVIEKTSPKEALTYAQSQFDAISRK